MTSFLSTQDSHRHDSWSLSGEAVQFFGPLVAMPRREVCAVVAEYGGRMVDDEPTLVVLGDDASEEQAEEAAEIARQTGGELIEESEFFERLGLVGNEQGVSRLYTTAMLAGLIEQPVATVRRWERRGYLVATERLNRLAFFDYQEATVAQRLAALVESGKSLAAIDRLMAQLTSLYPDLERPLAELPLVVDNGELLLRSGDTLTEPGGQRLLDFDGEASAEDEGAGVVAFSEEIPTALSPKLLARNLEDEGRYDEAVESWRIGMLDELITAEDHFTLAELLYLAGDPNGARERYYAALELDANYLEARVNLGCVLAELGDPGLAIAAFRGALETHEPFADAHYHLAVALDGVDAPEAAERHWRRFLEIAPDSPWASEARERLAF